VSVMLRLLANLHAEGVAVDLSVLYGGPGPVTRRPQGPTVNLPVGDRPKRIPGPTPVTAVPEMQGVGRHFGAPPLALFGGGPGGPRRRWRPSGRTRRTCVSAPRFKSHSPKPSRR